MYEEFTQNRIAQLRTQKGVSARDMSLSLGQNKNYINLIENGKALPSLSGLFYICDYFGITPEEFFHKDTLVPQKVKELVQEIEKLSPSQAEHILEVMKDLGNKK